MNDPTWRPGVRSALLIAFVGACAAGFLQLAAHAGGHVILGRSWPFHARMVWLAPLANLLAFVPAVAMVMLARRRHGDAAAIAAAIGCAVALALTAPALLLRPRLNLVSILILTTAIGVTAARWLLPRARSLGGVVRAMAVASLVIALAGEALIRVAEVRRARTGATARAEDTAPNVLLLVLDTVRALSMSVYGYERLTTPNLARLAREGVRFDRAVATASWTLASHASLFTGLYPQETSIDWFTPLDDEAPVLAEVLAARGWATGGFAANLTYTTSAFGLARGFQTYQDYLITPSEALRTSTLTRLLVHKLWDRWRGVPTELGRPSARHVTDRFLAWQRGVAAERRPFFAFLNYFDAHSPYAPPAPFDTLYLGRQARVRNPGSLEGKPSAGELADLQAAYDASIAYLDVELGRLFESLRERGVLDRTVVIVVSDHGEEFMEKGFLEHGDDLYFQSLHVPLLIRFPPRVASGVVVDTPVSIRDVAATVLDLSDVAREGEGAASFPGRSLARFWIGSAADSDSSELALLSELPFSPNLPPDRPVSKGPMASAVSEGLHLIRRGDGVEELYDIMRDPFQKQDLLPTRGTEPVVAGLRDALRRAGLPRKEDGGR